MQRVPHSSCPQHRVMLLGNLLDGEDWRVPGTPGHECCEGAGAQRSDLSGGKQTGGRGAGSRESRGGETAPGDSRPRGSGWTGRTYLGPGRQQPLQLLVLVAALQQADFVGAGLGLRAAHGIRQQLRPGRGVRALTGHRPLPPSLPAGSRALQGKKRAAPSKECMRLSPGVQPQVLWDQVRTQLCDPQEEPTLPPLPLPRARCSKQAGSSECCRPVGWRARAVDTGWLPPALTRSVPVVCTGRAGSECPRRTSGCTHSSSPLTNWEETKTSLRGTTFPADTVAPVPPTAHGHLGISSCSPGLSGPC